MSTESVRNVQIYFSYTHGGGLYIELITDPCKAKLAPSGEGVKRGVMWENR